MRVATAKAYRLFQAAIGVSALLRAGPFGPCAGGQVDRIHLQSRVVRAAGEGLTMRQFFQS
jgi:hypothetical protein